MFGDILGDILPYRQNLSYRVKITKKMGSNFNFYEASVKVLISPLVIDYSLRFDPEGCFVYENMKPMIKPTMNPMPSGSMPMRSVPY